MGDCRKELKLRALPMQSRQAEQYGAGSVWAERQDPERLSAASKSGANQGDLSMPIETILMIVALIVAILVLAIGLRPPPLYSDKERLPKREDLNAEKDD